MAINKIVYEKMSKRARAEFDTMIQKKQNAFDMITDNYFGLETCDSNAFCSRLQLEQFVLNPDFNTLQQSGKNGWWQNEANELGDVNEKLFPIIEIEGTVDEDPKAFYSSFGLKEISEKYTLRYPMDDDYTSSIAPFAHLSMSDANFNILVSKIQSSLKVKINNGELNKRSAYKRAFGSLAITKIKNIGLKLIGRAEKATTAFAGKLSLASKTKANYKFTNIEKTVKIYDELFMVAIAKQIKFSKGKYKGLSKDIRFASRLYANILMAKITDFGNPEINARVEKCLSLQFANVLNRHALDSDALTTMASLGVSVALETCKQMGLSKEDIIKRAILNGAKYPKVPTTEEEAIMFATGRDYSKYNEKPKSTENAQTLETENQTIVAGKEKSRIESPNVQDAPTVALNAGITKEQLASGTRVQDAVIQLGAPKVSGHLSAGTGFVVVDDGATLKDEVINLGAPKVSGLLAEKNPVVTPKYGNVKDLYSGNMYNMKTISERLVEQLPEEFKKEQLAVAMERYKQAHPETKAVSKKAIAKVIDKVVIKMLSDKVISINTKLNAHRYSKVGGKENGQKASDVYSQVLSYYTNSLNTTKKVSETCKESGTLYTRAKKVCDQIIDVKNKIVDAICDGAEVAKRNIEETTVKFINRRFKEISDYNIKDFFKIYIEKLPKIYGDLEKQDSEK